MCRAVEEIHGYKDKGKKQRAAGHRLENEIRLFITNGDTYGGGWSHASWYAQFTQRTGTSTCSWNEQLNQRTGQMTDAGPGFAAETKVPPRKPKKLSVTDDLDRAFLTTAVV